MCICMYIYTYIYIIYIYIYVHTHSYTYIRLSVLSKHVASCGAAESRFVRRRGEPASSGGLRE